MTKSISKLAFSASAVALALTPIAASANTRAGDSSVVYGESVSQPGQGRSSEGESAAGSSSLVSILIGFYIGAWTTLFVNEVTDDDNRFDDGIDQTEFQSTGV